MDQTTNLETLKLIVKDFCEARQWDQFHNLKDLAIGLSTESNELLELFRFKNENEIAEKLTNDSYNEKIKNELADVLFFTLRISQKYNIDLSQSFFNKMRMNNEKYPIEISRGSNKKYNE